MNKATNTMAKVLLLLLLAMAGMAKAQDYEPIIQEGNEWYTIPREGCKKEYWFLLVLGKNGGAKSFASEILDPVSTLLKTLEVDGCVFPDIVDVSLDNADDVHYFVIHTSK
jgi:hypothetical protein